MTSQDDPFLRAAIAEAEQGLREGGIPIGSVLVIDRGDYVIVRPLPASPGNRRPRTRFRVR